MGILALTRFAAALLGCIAAFASLHAQDAKALKTRHAELRNQLAKNPFARPFYLKSEQTSAVLKGDIYTIVEYPFAMVGQALQPIGHWCDILILHLNVKGCRSTAKPGGGILSLAVGKKFDQPVEDTYALKFDYRVAAASADYLQIELNAKEGPFGTKNYRIGLEATPIDANRSFIHMSYSYSYGLAARMAMQSYLTTMGREKVGFTLSKQGPDGLPTHIGGILGLVERNTMRYYLAIDSYLSAYSLPPAEQTEKRLETWFAATERYSTQLHEMNREQYIEIKRKEIRRQRAGVK